MLHDLYLTRAILRQIQRSESVEIPTYSADLVDRHLDLLRHHGFTAPLGDRIELTWKGHDLAGTLGNDAVWDKLRDKFSASDLASMPISVLARIAHDLTAQWAREKAGLA